MKRILPQYMPRIGAQMLTKEAQFVCWKGEGILTIKTTTTQEHCTNFQQASLNKVQGFSNL